MTAQELIAKFGETITVTRKSPGTFTDGMYSEGAVSSFTTLASVQPINGREQVSLTELQRTKETLKIYTTTELLTSNEQAGVPADLVSFRGKVYSVEKVEPWLYDLAFFKVIIARVEQ